MTSNMNTTANIGLQVIATGLVAFGAQAIQTDLKTGAISIILGIIAYAVYELTPSSR